HAGADQRFAASLFSPFHGICGWRVRAVGVDSERGRSLRVDRLLSKPANTRDRRAHGAGRAKRFGVQAGAPPGWMADGNRADYRVDLLDRSVIIHTQLAVRRAGLGCSDANLRGHVVGGCVDSSDIHTGAARGFGRSHASAASGITRLSE